MDIVKQYITAMCWMFTVWKYTTVVGRANPRAAEITQFLATFSSSTVTQFAHQYFAHSFPVTLAHSPVIYKNIYDNNSAQHPVPWFPGKAGVSCTVFWRPAMQWTALSPATEGLLQLGFILTFCQLDFWLLRSLSEANLLEGKTLDLLVVEENLSLGILVTLFTI